MTPQEASHPLSTLVAWHRHDVRESSTQGTRAFPQNIRLGGILRRWTPALSLGALLSMSTMAQAAPAGHAFYGPGQAGSLGSATVTPSGAWKVLASPSARDEQLYLLSLREQASGNPYGFTRDTNAATCAATCHPMQLSDWEDAYGSDMVANPIWDSNDQAGQLDPNNSKELGSMHNLAWKDYEFQLIYHEQTEANAKNCVRCHVPDTALYTMDLAGVVAPNSRSISSPNLSEGITCVSCHLDSSGQINSDISLPETASNHAVIANDMFKDPVELCASCHDDPLYGSLSQTATEHLQQRPSADVNCVSCHMSDNTGEIRHWFDGGHSPSHLKGALQVTLPTTLTSRDNFTATLKNVGAMHNVPTGEKFRAFVLNVQIIDNKGSTVIRKETWVTPNVVTPTSVEVVGYDRIDPIAFNSSKSIRHGTLSRGTYTVKASLTYYQVKPTTMKSTTTGATSVVTGFGQAKVNEWSYTLQIKS